uniref:Uncharacterized protein n=1 Tax=Lepeophtheirus salmonis TaxID=72036 RepID=A0A0K2THF5_LEPSM
MVKKIMSPESVKTNKMKHHFDAKYPNFMDKDVHYFKNKADGVKKTDFMFVASTFSKKLQPLKLHSWWLELCLELNIHGIPLLVDSVHEVVDIWMKDTSGLGLNMHP